MLLFSAQAAEAPPFPFGRKRRQKGPFCTASGGTGMLLNPFDVFGEAHKNSTAHAVSNSLCARFSAKAEKSPHEPAESARSLPPLTYW